MYIPERFKKVLTLHIVKNLVQQYSISAPRALGIHGPSGYGKTYQCEVVLQELGIKSFLISGRQLESSNAGEPAKLVRTIYIKAGKAIEQREFRASVLLINDIDTGLGNWGDKVQYTTNRQMVFGELMHITDYPNIVDGKETRRIPVVITGNDFTKLYEPLVRAGRMTAFSWIPTLEEKNEIVAGIFPELNKNICQKLVGNLHHYLMQKHYSEEILSIAFFRHLRSMLLDDIIWNAVSATGLRQSIDYIVSGQEPDFNFFVSYDALYKMGCELIELGQLVNHLRK